MLKLGKAIPILFDGVQIDYLAYLSKECNKQKK